MDLFQKTKKGIVATLIVCIVSIGAVIVLYVTLDRKIDDVAQLRQDVQVAKRDDVVSIKRSIRAFDVHKELLDIALIDQKDIFSFIDALEALGEHGGAKTAAQQVLVVDVANDGTTAPPQTLDATVRSHGKLTLTMRLDGSWESIMNFLLALEQLPRATTITSTRFDSVYEPNTSAQSWVALFELVTIIE